MPKLYFKAPCVSPFWRILQLFISQKKRPQDYHIAIKEWIIFLGSKPGTKKAAKLMQNATIEDALSYMEYQKYQPGVKTTQLFHDRDELRSNATIAKRVDILKHIYNMLLSQALVERNPFALVRKPPAQAMQKQPTQVFEAKFVQRMIDKCPASPQGVQHRAILSCLFGAALRRSECARLLIGDVRQGVEGFWYLFLRDTKTKQDYNQECQELLMRYILKWCDLRLRNGAKPTDYLWSTVGNIGGIGKEISGQSISRIVKRYALAAGVGIHVSAHSARATVATEMLSQGVPIEEVSRFLRHASIQSTLKYDKRRLQGSKSPARKILF